MTDAEKAELEDLFKTQFGTEADYLIWSENKPLLPYLRTQVGISDEAIQLKFGSFLNGDELSADQLEYMGHIISFAKENGDIVFLDLQRESPFCDLDVVELFGAKISHIKTLINGLHRPMM